MRIQTLKRFGQSGAKQTCHDIATGRKLLRTSAASLYFCMAPSKDAAAARIENLVSEEHAMSVHALIQITEQEHLLDNAPVLQRSIRLRNPYVDPLSYIQVSLLRRFRSIPESSPEREVITYLLLLTIAAISSGLLNTG